MKLLRKGYLQVSPLHKIYFELRGKKAGIPVVHLHGGPGSNFRKEHFARYSGKHCVLFFDQRGCGKSTPSGELRENTTKELVEDIAALMDRVGFKNARVCGGSWGSTLALCFAIKYPNRVRKLVISQIYLGTKQENDVIIRNFQLFSPQFVDETTGDLSYSNPSKAVRSRLQLLEYSIIDNSKVWTQVREGKMRNYIESHYLSKNCFLPAYYIMKNLRKIIHIPTVIIQGQQDLLCPPLVAWKLHKKLPKSKFILVPTGHRIPDISALYKRYV